MSPAPFSDALRAFALELDQKLGGIFMVLRPLVGKHFYRHPWVHFSVTVPLWNRFGRYAQRLSRLMARIAAGRLPIARASRPRKPEDPARPVNRKPRVAMPTQYGWMLKAMGYHVAVHRNALERLLAEPAMAELLAVAPGLGRIIRPLCHMLMLPPPPKPPKAAAAPDSRPAPGTPAPPRPRAAPLRPFPATPLHPLTRGRSRQVLKPA